MPDRYYVIRHVISISITFHFIIHIIVHIRYPFSYLFISLSIFVHILSYRIIIMHLSYLIHFSIHPYHITIFMSHISDARYLLIRFDNVLLALTLNVFSYVFLGHCCYKSPPSASWTIPEWNLDRIISSICDGLFAFRSSYSGRTVDFTLPSIGHMVWYFDRSAEDINVPASSFKFRAVPLSNYIVLPTHTSRVYPIHIFDSCQESRTSTVIHFSSW